MVYEYSCPNCSNAFEVHRSIHSEDTTALCPSCGNVAKQIFSLAGWIWRNPEPLYNRDGSYQLKF